MNSQQIRELVIAHQDELYRYVKYMGADASTAREVVQSAFIGAYNAKKQPDLADTSQRIAWLRSIARNVFYQHCRKQKRSQLVYDSDFLQSAEDYWVERSGDTQDETQKIIALKQCLERLPEKQTRIVELFYKSKVSRQAIALTLKMREDGVKTALRRIRAKLYDCIQNNLINTNPNSEK
ncbi:MAG: RNA polymerase sigma factor [Opitutales bacterium]